MLRQERGFPVEEPGRLDGWCSSAQHPWVVKLVGDIDGEIEVDGDGLVGDGAGPVVELADDIDDTFVPEGAERLDDANVLRTAVFIDGEGKTDLSVAGEQTLRGGHGEREVGGVEEHREDNPSADAGGGWGRGVVHGRASVRRCSGEQRKDEKAKCEYTAHKVPPWQQQLPSRL